MLKDSEFDRQLHLRLSDAMDLRLEGGQFQPSELFAKAKASDICYPGSSHENFKSRHASGIKLAQF